MFNEHGFTNFDFWFFTIALALLVVISLTNSFLILLNRKDIGRHDEIIRNTLSRIAQLMEVIDRRDRRMEKIVKAIHQR